jgi:hypothetical protein
MPKARFEKLIRLPHKESNIWDLFSTRYARRTVTYTDLPAPLAEKVYAFNADIGRFKEKVKKICKGNRKTILVNPDYYYDTPDGNDDLKCVRAAILTHIERNLIRPELLAATSAEK